MQPTDPAQQADPSRLLSVVRPADSRHLIVCFNGYGVSNRPGQQPHLPFATHLQSYSRIVSYDAHAIWFVEAGASWYLEHQDDILAILADYVMRHRIDTIRMIGASAGGYAAFRYGFLLDQLLARLQWSGAILSIPVNPQTGFRPDLLERIRREEIALNWGEGRLGTDPVILAPALVDRYGAKVIDLSRLAEIGRPRAFASILLNDDGNPIDRIFADDLAGLDYVVRVAKRLGLSHSQSAEGFLNEGLWEIFNHFRPFPRLSTPSLEPRLLNR